MAVSLENSQAFHLYVQTPSGTVEVQFSDCILELLNLNNEGEISFKYENNSLHLRSCNGSSILLKHSSSCPFMEKIEPFQVDENSKKKPKISLAVAVLIQSSDGYILLNRRPLHMRTFPGIWVVPGGHVESGESLEKAIIRELFEETGLSIDLKHDFLSVQCMWESAFPPVLLMGDPIRHHLIIYFHCKMMKTCEEIQKNIRLQADEVSLSLWLDLEQLKALVLDDYEKLLQISPEIIVTEITKHIAQYTSKKKIEELFAFKNFAEGRIAAGTRYALEQVITKLEKSNWNHSHL